MKFAGQWLNEATEPHEINVFNNDIEGDRQSSSERCKGARPCTVEVLEDQVAQQFRLEPSHTGGGSILGRVGASGWNERAIRAGRFSRAVLIIFHRLERSGFD